ncbi:kinase-like domain-containing protein, partial [Suillus subalutaceus]|uniref:kinase-like domain-containing protein n=1 Tax=Suillus subalutaceus TaxID=48586 RepID=UPI001B88093A
RQAYIWTQFLHDNILPLEGVTVAYEFEPLPTLVTPWMENGCLDDYLRQKFGLSWERKLSMVREVAAGLEYLHDKDIVHGNLTAHNILLDGSGHVHIADFSHSIILAEAGSWMFSEQPSGDARYTAPESIFTSGQTGASKPTKSGDVYSYGCVLNPSYLSVGSGRQGAYHYVRNQAAIINNISHRIMPKRLPTSDIIDSNWDFMQTCWSRDMEHRPLTKTFWNLWEDELKFNHSECCLCTCLLCVD